MTTLKDPDEFLGGDTLAQAMAHASWDVVNNLKLLGSIESGFIQLHDLRLTRFGKEAWIDHLLIHRYGVVVIESRTAAVPLHRSSSGLWFREVEDSWVEIYSPIKHVRKNAHFVKEMLREAQHKLLERGELIDIVARLRVDTYVAIAPKASFTSDDIGFSTILVDTGSLAGLVNDRHLDHYLDEPALRKRFPFQQGLLSPREVLHFAQHLLHQHQPLYRGAKYSGFEQERYLQHGLSASEKER